MAARRSEVVFVTLALLGFGTLSVATVPPGQAPDEAYSFLRAYHVASGHAWPEPVGAWGGGNFPRSATRVVDVAAPLIGRPDRKFTRSDWDALAERDVREEWQPASYPTAAPYTCVPYLAPAAGIRIAWALDLPPLGIFYAGRLANLLLGTAIVALALALAPIGRRFLGLVALMPMTVHLFGSYAPEVGVIGAALVIASLVQRLGIAERAVATWEVGLLALAMTWIGACKPPYLPLALLILTVPAGRFGGPLRRGAVVAAILSAGLAVTALGVELSRPYYPDPHTFLGPVASVREQSRELAAHPERFPGLFVGAAVVRGGPTYHRLYVLGWLDTRLNPGIVVLHTLVLMLLAAAARAEMANHVRLSRWPAMLAAAGAFALVVLSMYLWCTPVGGSTVVGIHGRYLLPLLPAAVILAPACRISSGVQRLIAVGAALIVLSVAAVAVIQRYYLT